MTRKIMGLFFIALVTWVVSGWAVEYPLTVENLTVEGNDEISWRDILDVVAFDEGDQVEEAELRAASQAIFDLGWFSEVSLDYDRLPDGDVVYRVVENARITDIVITGNTHRVDYQLFGVKLFDLPIMGTNKVRQILRQNDVRKREVLNQDLLTLALEEIQAEYQRRGYPVIQIANVSGMSEVLEIEILEPEYMGDLFEGLHQIPEIEADELVNIPTGEPLRSVDASGASMALSQSVFFSGVGVDLQQGLDVDTFWLRWTLEERRLIAEPVEIQAIEIEGNLSYPTEVLADLIGEIPSQSITNYELLTLVQGIHDRYIRGGYSMIELSVSGVEQGVLTLTVAEGEISEILLQGNTRTEDYVILRNSELVPGKVFNFKDFAVTYQQLMSLGYFRSVNIMREWGDDGVVVTIVISEKSDLGGFGGSMAIDPSTGDLFGELSLNEKNVFGTGQDFELSYSRGLVSTEDSSPSTWNLGYSTVAYFPGFDRVGVNLYQKTEEVFAEGEETASDINITLGAEISFSYPVADYSSLYLAFRHEEEHLSSESNWIPADVVNIGLNFDDTNDPFFPTDGSRRRLSLEKAGGFSAGREYTRMDFTWTTFSPATLKLVATDMDQAFAVRVRAGWSDDQLPASKRTELGGPMSIRGVVGEPARQFVFSNAEYRIQLVEGFHVTAFWDAGFDLGAVRLDDLRSSFGLELGINAAGIIVRLDLAWALNEDFTWMPVFDFGFGQMF